MRRKIILAPYGSKRLSYVEFMKIVKVVSIGKFNYHLKILGDLIEKDQNGKYSLTEKGQTAAQLLQKFPQRKPREENKLLKDGYNFQFCRGTYHSHRNHKSGNIQFYSPSSICFPEPLSRVNLPAT